MLETLSNLILLAGLLAISLQDLKDHRIPDVLSLPLIAIGLGAAALLGDLRASIIGAGVAYLVFVAIEQGYLRLRGRHGLGRGDAKLFAVGGAWFGWQALPSILLVGAGLGLAYVVLRHRGRAEPLPFAPFLSLGIAAQLFT